MKKPSDVTHIDDNGVRYSYLGENNYAVWMDKEKHPYWRPMPHNTIECASSIRSVSDIDRIAELEKERNEANFAVVPRKLTKGMRIAYHESIERHENCESVIGCPDDQWVAMIEQYESKALKH